MTGPPNPDPDSPSVDERTVGSAELRRALVFLGRDRDARTVVRRGYWAGGIAGCLAAVVGVAFGGVPVGGPLTLAVGLATTHAAHRLPVWRASLRRSRALGAAPELVGRAVLRCRIDPAAERAARFAARTGDGPLAASLGRHVDLARDSPGSGLRTFASEWGAWFPALKRATMLIRAASSAPPERRGRSLDRALSTVTAGTADRMAAFAGEVRGPVTGLYAFGVLLPLALVALLPAARVAGFPVTPLAMTLLYTGLLPAGLVVAGGWLLLRRPVAFPPATVDSSHPAVTDRRPHAVAAGVGVGSCGWLLAARTVATWSGPLAAAGFGIGSVLVLYARSRRTVHARAREIESGLADALSAVGADVAEGVSVERAVADAGETVPGAAGDAFDRAARRMETLRIGVREAFLGAGGPFAELPSPRARSAAVLIAIAAREGRPAGDVVLELADQIDELRELERAAVRDLSTVTRTLANTAAVFGPLVGGATVALAAGIGAEPVGLAGTEREPIPIATLGRIVGTYVLLLAVVLTALATALERGLDRTLLAHRVGIALPAATATYLVAFVAARRLLGL